MSRIMKTNRRKRNRQSVNQWIAALSIIAVILTAMITIIHLSNESVTGPSTPAVSTSFSDRPQSDDLNVSNTSNTQSGSHTSTDTTTTTTTTTSTTASTTSTTTTTAKKNGTPCTVTAEYANIRSGPGAGYDFIQKVFSGETYNIIGQATANNGIMWYEIELSGGKTGYICGAFVNYNGNGSNNDQTTTKEAYLTFDDGPSSNTLKILDILDKYNVKATFFVIYHKGQEDAYRAIVERGHTLALHSYTHTYSEIYKSKTAFFDDLDKLSNYVSNITGITPLIMRFPGGSSNTVSKKYCKGIMSELTGEVQKRGYSYYDWNVDSGDADAVTVDKDKIVANIKNNLGNRSNACILMHDASAKTTTVEALPEIIEYLQSRGYSILPITGSTPLCHHKVNN